MNSGERIVETYNLFLDSDDAKGDGQNYDFQFGNNNVQTRDKAQFIRLSLINFNMYKNWTDVNPYNAGMVLKSSGGTIDTPVTLDSQNYAIQRDLVKNWADNFRTAAVTVFGGVWGATTTTSWTPNAGTGINGTTNNICSFILTTTNPHGLTNADVLAGNFSLSAVINPSAAMVNAGVSPGADSALLLGGDRVADDYLPGSYAITFPSTTTIKVSGYYPGQRSSEPNVYVRCNPAPQIFGSPAFESPLTLDMTSELNPVAIMAEIRIDTEMVQYEPQSNRQYFVNMYQKSLSHLQVRLTDSKSRLLPTPVYPNTLDYQTAGGPATAGTLQTTKGNRHFTATIRVEIVEGVSYGETVPTGHIPHSLPARFDSNLMIQQKNGRNMYNVGPGYS